MTLLRETFKETAPGIGLASSMQDLAVIHDPSCAAAVCKRTFDAGVLSWLDRLEPSRLPKARVILRPDRVSEALEQICDMSKTPDCPERDSLIEDATALATTFAAIMNAPYLRVRIDIITTNACRKFHIDALTARLICTYRGTGTQYGIATDAADPADIFTVPTGSPIVLRGTNWPEHPASGLKHRSPPIEGTQETRSVLVLDPIFDLEEDV